MGGHNNYVARDLYKRRKFGGMKNVEQSTALYKEYIEDETAQYEMSFFEYKTLGKRGRDRRLRMKSVRK